MDFNSYPPLISSFLSYKLNIQGRSLLTVKEYAIDLRYFFRYFISKATGVEEKKADLSLVDKSLCESVTQHDIYSFLLELAGPRHLKPTTRGRKLAAIRSFYKYHTSKSGMLINNPAKDVDPPKMLIGLPKVMSLGEANQLLDSFDKKHINYHRDYLIAVLFLHCGIRLSELVGINLPDIDSDLQRFVVRGKGGKTRALYLNPVCRLALLDYLNNREKATLARGHKVKDKNALFLSSNGVRISNKTVQWIIKKQFEKCGLANKGYSVHKLRHTAATLMYNEGRVDVMMLKEILGHSQLSTTQIYTHVNSDAIKEAMSRTPLNTQTDTKKTRRKKRKIEYDYGEPLGGNFLFSADGSDAESEDFED